MRLGGVSLKINNNWFLVLVVLLTGLSIFGYTRTNFVPGLDVAGGVRLTYQMDLSELPASERANPARFQSKLQRILEARVAATLGVVEGAVATKGEDQFIVELPGNQSIDEARQVLSNTAKIQVYHARTVSNPKRQKFFNEAGRETVAGVPQVNFVRGSGAEVLEPGMPGYKAMIDGWDLILEGEDVARADVEGAANGTYRPTFQFSAEGARKLEQWSRRYSREQENIAFVLDGRVLNIAPLKENTVLSDNAVIDGEFDATYLRQFVSLVNSGSLPVPLKELSSQSVAPTIGQQALQQMLIAGAISLGITCLFLVVYYAFPGFLAVIAMALYVLLTVTFLKLVGATFSLAAIAALILSASMAVDANILVFERIKEEIRNGKQILTAVELGFKRAFTSILDSNACTILTSAVLWAVGTSSVKGFATTLIVGVAISFFTALAVTRSLLVGLVSLGIGADAKYFAMKRNWFGENFEQNAETKPIEIVKNRKRYFLISGAIILPGLIAIGLGGIKPNVEFQGGFEAQYVMPQGKTLDSVRQGLNQAGFEGFNLKAATFGQQQTVYITLPEGNGLRAGDPEAKGRIAQAAGLSVEGGSFNSIGPTVRNETIASAIFGVLGATVLIVCYLTLRFGFGVGGIKNGIRFALSAMAALIHDVVFVIGAAAVVGLALGWEVSALFITAMLTVIGFSVHDTIVIFDRIRENLRRQQSGESFEHLVDRSISASFARSINTSGTAIITLIVLIAVGTPTPELKFMCLTMLLGIVVGTYSSIFNAAPILFLWDAALVKVRGEKAGLMAEARNELKLRAAQVMSSAAGTGEDALATATAGGQYGTVKRRRSIREQASQNLDDEP